MEPKVIFEDDWVVVIDKPAGMVVNKSKTSGNNTVQAWFEKQYLDTSKNGDTDIDSEFWQKGGMVHRLDKDTSGIMVMAKTQVAYERLKQQFLERKTQKTYWALVHGVMTDKNGILSRPIIRHPKSFGKFIVGDDLSRTAITEWETIGEYQTPVPVSELKLKPLTGRTHQLRVHLKYLGHSIVGDVLYAGRKTLVSDRKWCDRMCLHALNLKFLHPDGNKLMEFEAKLPQELERVRAELIH